MVVLVFFFQLLLTIASVTVFLGICSVAAAGLNPENDQQTLRIPIIGNTESRKMA